MPNITTKEFKFLKKRVEEDKAEHDKKLSELNDPEGVIRAYSGRLSTSASKKITENYLFIAINTILPSLYFQNPRPMIQARDEQNDFTAALLNGLVDIYMGDKEKYENQSCIIDAFLPYGYSIMKNGYNSRSQRVKLSEKAQGFMTGTQGKDTPNGVEGDAEFILYEQPVILRQSPKTTYLDASQPFGKGNRITFEYDRTLRQLKESGIYELTENFINYFTVRGKEADDRDSKLKLFEHWYMEGGKVKKLVYVEGWDEAISDGETLYDTIPVSYLRFNNMGDILYNVSHGSLALAAQEELDYLNTLWKKHLDGIRNQIAYNPSRFTESGIRTLKANEIGGMAETTGPLTAADLAPIQSAQMDSNLFANIQQVRSYLNLILSTTGVKTGGDPEELATSERQKQFGDAVRTSGMQENIRDFIRNQIKQMIKNILRFSSPELKIKLQGENMVFPRTGEIIPNGTMVEIGGTTGFSLQELIQGDIDVDYIFDVDITTAQRPDFPVVRKQLAEGITLASQMMPILQAEGKKIDVGSMLEDYFSTFDAVSNPKKYIKNISEQEKMMMVQQAQAQAMGGGVPTEQGIEQGAAMTPPETAGMGGQI